MDTVSARSYMDFFGAVRVNIRDSPNLGRWVVSSISNAPKKFSLSLLVPMSLGVLSMDFLTEVLLELILLWSNPGDRPLTIRSLVTWKKDDGFFLLNFRSKLPRPSTLRPTWIWFLVKKPQLGSREDWSSKSAYELLLPWLCDLQFSVISSLGPSSSFFSGENSGLGSGSLGFVVSG